ncbi:uncharacterized protein A4U43_C01F7690 [Asparagus officinalis]|uniref:RRM domain-containing protein n=1 Tax=Asparagus officinalis TaxID=4686 RepID=A0A5P1FQ78_ASPOF|nr:ras GTPase-activating protein-binding protein 1 [Asparagus officinalis]ONK79567.1 uncharacterized protein A4U43_C01F7690 [Asparagus officinalis]
MAAMFPGQFNVSEVGKYFVTQYYQIIHQNPHVGYQFYNDSSTMLRIDGDNEKLAVSTMEIHSLLSDLSFTSIEIKTLHAQASWGRGVLVMVSGFVQMKDYGGRRKFVQTFFLAPQEKGYFVLNDIFHLLDEETTVQPCDDILDHNNYDTSSKMVNHHMQDPGYTVGEVIQSRDYVSPGNALEEELQAREYVAPLHSDEIDTVDKYSIPEPQYNIPEPQYSMPEAQYSMPEAQYSIPESQYSVPEDQYSIPEAQYSIPEAQYNIPETQEVSEADDKLDEIPVEEPTASFPGVGTVVRDPPASAGEPSGERPKQTYASILRLAKEQSVNSMPRAAPVSKMSPSVSDARIANPQPSYPATPVQPENSEAVEDLMPAEDEGEVKSVYVGNLSSSVSASDLEHEFKNFGRIRPNGVTVRSRKDSGGFYAFVEFEDAASVQSALQASPILVNGRQIYVEERRPNSGISRMGGGRRGRGRGAYQSEVPRYGGRSFSRSGETTTMIENILRSAGNGVLPRVPRQERGILGNHASRNGQDPSEAAYY